MLPPNQQLVARDKWPIVGERMPARSSDHPGQPWTVTAQGLVSHSIRLSLDELRSLNNAFTEKTVDIHCVTRWSRPSVCFGGIPLAEVVHLCKPSQHAQYVSFVAYSNRNHSTSLPLSTALELGTLIALTADGKPLPTAHGGPVRIVVPERYFYKSLKWLKTIDFLAEDRPGYWEAEAGYHNEADPWQEQRYAVANLDRHEVAKLLQSRNFSGRELRNLAAANLDLHGLNATGAILRNADFRRADLTSTVFDGANLSNARFQGARLCGASFQPLPHQAADLEGADFRGADLRGAIFRDVSLFGASFCGDPDSPSESAVVDRTTVFDSKSLNSLTAMPQQLDFIRRQVQTCD